MRTLLKGGTIVTSSGTRRADVLLEDEKIVKIGRDLNDADTVHDVTGCLLFPGWRGGRRGSDRGGA